MMNSPPRECRGILLIDKPAELTSFACVHAVRKRLLVEKVGHAGTLDPFATGLLIILVGKEWTRQQDLFMKSDKEYYATVTLGAATDTYDITGREIEKNDKRPTHAEIEAVLLGFQGVCLQTPPMFSAKKIKGKRLYELARKGMQVERSQVQVHLATNLIEYDYPFLSLHIHCSKGTYVRSIGDEIGRRLGCYGHLSSLRRSASGGYKVADALPYADLTALSPCDIASRLLTPYEYRPSFLLPR